MIPPMLLRESAGICSRLEETGLRRVASGMFGLSDRALPAVPECDSCSSLSATVRLPSVSCAGEPQPHSVGQRGKRVIDPPKLYI